MQKKKGISLIVLVITIVVMIILAGTVIISLNNSGIIERAGTAVKAYNEDEVNHIAQMAWSEAYIKGASKVEEFESAINQALEKENVDKSKFFVKVTISGVTVRNINSVWVQDGLKIKKGDVTLEAGDLIQYNAKVSGYTGAWKVLGAEDGNLLIMSTASVGEIHLYGLEGNGTTTNYGLLNGIAGLNEICKPYEKGLGAVGSRSINVDDVNKLTEYNPITYGGNELKKYGNKVTYLWDSTTNGKVDYTSTNGKSGTLSTTYNNGFSYIDFNTMTKTTVAVNGNGMPILTGNFYVYDASNTTLPARSNKANTMIFGTGDGVYYWLASTYTYTHTSNAIFGLRCIGSKGVRNLTLYYSDGNIRDYDKYGVRAVVFLSPDIQVGEKDDTKGWAYSVNSRSWIQDGTTITKGNVTLEAGDLIQYNAGVSGYTGAWKVLGAEDGKLLIMSTEDVTKLKLYKLEGNGTTTNYGLLNGIARLNELCEPYGEGTGAVGARSIKVEDVDKLTGFDKTTYGANKIFQYGNKVTYSWNTSNSGKVDYTSTNGVSGTLDSYPVRNT